MRSCPGKRMSDGPALQQGRRQDRTLVPDQPDDADADRECDKAGIAQICRWQFAGLFQHAFHGIGKRSIKKPFDHQHHGESDQEVGHSY